MATGSASSRGFDDKISARDHPLTIRSQFALGAEVAVEGLAGDAEFFAEGVDLGVGVFEGGLG